MHPKPLNSSIFAAAFFFGCNIKTSKQASLAAQQQKIKCSQFFFAYIFATNVATKKKKNCSQKKRLQKIRK